MKAQSTTFHAPYAHGPDLRGSAAAVVARTVSTLALWRARASQRRALRELSPGLLADIGVSAAQAAVESRKPFWRA